MMRNYGVLISLLIVIVLAGCSQEGGYRLNGESDNWKGNLAIHSNGESGTYTFYYKNDDWENVGYYTVTIGNQEVVRTEEGLANSSIIINVSQLRNIDTASSNAKPVIIEWDGKEEELVLAN